MICNTSQKDCCGCTACASVCPARCIEMQPDDKGFLMPFVNMDKCIGCNLCEKVCPMNIDSIKKQGIDSAFVVRNKDKYILKKSSSGGFYSSLCNYVLNNNEYCVGVVFYESWNVRHIISNEYSDIPRFSGSKYIQSDIRGIYPKVKKLLEEKHLICFSGTPCQVAVLRSFLRKDYENLITVDFVCHGVPSPLLWQHYLLLFSGKDIKYINNRSKKYGYHSSVMQIDFQNGRSYYGSPRTDFALKSFYSDISSWLTCYECPFKGIERYSDFTIWDCWRPDMVDKSIKADDLGYTNVIVHDNA